MFDAQRFRWYHRVAVLGSLGTAACWHGPTTGTVAAATTPCIGNLDPRAEVVTITGQLAGRAVKVGIRTTLVSTTISADLARQFPVIASTSPEGSGVTATPVRHESLVSGLVVGGHAYPAFLASIQEADDGTEIRLGLPQLEGLRLVLDLRAGAACIQPGGTLEPGYTLRARVGLLLAPVTVNDRDVQWWVIDPGERRSAAYPDGFPELPNHDEHPVGNFGSAAPPLLMIERLCVVGVCKGHQLVRELDEMFGLRYGQGIVGTSFLRGSVLTIDLASHRLRIE